METQTMLPTALARATEALGDALASSPPFLAYRQAQARLEQDEHARASLDRLADVERDVRKRQADGAVTREDIDRVRAAQNEAWSEPVVMDVRATHQEAAAYLAEVNGIVTQLLGVDIAALAGAGGC